MSEFADKTPPDGVLRLRGRFDGVWNILRFNWPFYAVAIAIGFLGMAFLKIISGPPWLLIFGWSGVVLAFFWLSASLLVSFYVYDCSPLYQFLWLKTLLAPAPRSWVNIHSGLDESSLILQAIFPTNDCQVLDIYNPQTMTEPAIARARVAIAAPVAAIAADYRALPLGDDSASAIFLIFAAHEIREPRHRLDFFKELQRIAAPQAQIILVEHLRDTANFLAFGPGFMHFLPESEWKKLAAQSGWESAREFSITPFVRVFTFQKMVSEQIESTPVAAGEL